MTSIQQKKVYIPKSITNSLTVMPLDFLVWPLVKHLSGHIITYPEHDAKQDAVDYKRVFETNW